MNIEQTFSILRRKQLLIGHSPHSVQFETLTERLLLCTGGFGVSPNRRVITRYRTKLRSGKTSCFQRSDIPGIIAPEKLPEWAKHYLEIVRQAEKKARNKGGR